MWKQIHTTHLQDPNTGHRYLETNIYDIPTRYKFLQVAALLKRNGSFNPKILVVFPETQITNFYGRNNYHCLWVKITILNDSNFNPFIGSNYHYSSRLQQLAFVKSTSLGSGTNN